MISEKVGFKTEVKEWGNYRWRKWCTNRGRRCDRSRERTVRAIDWDEVDGVQHVAHPRDKVKHIERNGQLFVTRMMSVDEREWPWKDEVYILQIGWTVTSLDTLYNYVEKKAKVSAREIPEVGEGNDEKDSRCTSLLTDLRFARDVWGCRSLKRLSWSSTLFLDDRMSFMVLIS